jgi:SAM-dependent methyltransferase
MTPQQFIAKWKPVKLTERSACQSHFLDLCLLLGQPQPVAADPEGAWYTFERGVTKSGGGHGWADVWMRGKFGWEYKKKRKDLKAAYDQLLQYRDDLENPPLLIVCDLDRFEIHTNFTGTARKTFEFDLDSLAEPQNLDVLRKAFTLPEALKPGETPETVTRAVSERIGALADGLKARKVPADDISHFLMKLVFCMFAEDIGLLGEKRVTAGGKTEPGLFTRLVRSAKGDPAKLAKQMRELFFSMANGGDFWGESILHFNGGLFDVGHAGDPASAGHVTELTPAEIKDLAEACVPDWENVEPSIFGTLFERILDPDKRSQLGAHYTSRADIETLLEPVVMQPLRREWEAVKAACEGLAAASTTAKTAASKKKKLAERDRALKAFVERLAHVTVLDPACGSGNFLYVALHLLLDLEKEVIAYAARQGLGLFPQVRPTQLAGIEINPYAQELASVVIWIGYLQWMHHNGFNPPANPVLEPIESIRRMDAILDLSDPENPTEPEWPEAEFIVGNPPFLGFALFRSRGLDDAYVAGLRSVYSLPGKSDLCCYWFARAQREILSGRAMRAGLLATQAIRHGDSLTVLNQIVQDGRIFFACPDRQWVLDGANVRVSMIGFGGSREADASIEGSAVTTINADLTAGIDIQRACSLASNQGIAFEGDQKGGKFDPTETDVLELLRTPNPNGLPSSDVLIPRANAETLVKIRGSLGWIIDFGVQCTEERAAGYEGPFEFVRRSVMLSRQSHSEEARRDRWWIHKRPRPEMRRALEGMGRYLVTPRVGKHRTFVWLEAPTLPDSRLFVFATNAWEVFGILQCRVHEVWSLRMGARHGDGEDGGRPTYNNEVCFETFPFPNPSDAQQDAIATAAQELDRLRTNWLNPPEWTRIEVLEFPGTVGGPWDRFIERSAGGPPLEAGAIGTVRYPRVVARDADCATKLKKRTLTNLYNERPTWLDLAHRRLDEAVFAAYGWDAGMSDDELLAALLALNLEAAG